MATHTQAHSLAHSHTLSRWQALFVALSMTIVKCHVQVQTSTQNAAICMHYAWPEIQSYKQRQIVALAVAVAVALAVAAS